MEKTKETMSSPNILDFCRLCLVKENVSVLIFEEGEDSRQIFRKISACLPVKVSRDDELPKKICDDCVCRLDSTYEFCNLSANSEKQLLQWLADSNSDHRKEQISLNTLETEQFTLKEEALDEQLIEVPKASSHVDSGVSDEIEQRSDEEDESEMDVEDDGTNSIDESEDTAEKDSEEEDFRVEPTTFVNVSMHDGDAGPSGIQKTDSEQPTEETLATLGPSTSKQSPAASGSQMELSIEVRKKSFKDVRTFKSLFTIQNKQGDSSVVTSTTSKLKCPHHNGKHGSYWCKVCNSLFLSDSERSQVFICNICGKEKSSLKTLKRHLHTHTDERPFSCTICKRGFRYNFELQNHGKIVHKGTVRIYSCRFCSFASVYRYNFKCHERKHLNQSESKIDVRESQTCKHDDKLIHSTDVPFICKFCGKAYSQVSKLEGHMFKHVLGEDSHYKCDICDKAFLHKSALVNHRSVHLHENSSICTSCSKVVTLECLTEHSLARIERKSFTCKTCLLVFENENSLSTHLTVHADAASPHTTQS